MEIQALSGVTGVFKTCVITQGTGATTSFAACEYAIDGMAVVAGAQSNVAGLAAAVQASGTTCAYLYQIDADENISVIKGDEVVTPVAAPSESTPPTVPSAGVQWPAPTAGNCALGGMILVATAAFTHGTTVQGTQDTLYSFLGGVPGRPKVS